MKRLSILALLPLALLLTSSRSGCISADGYYKGIKLCGKVRIVDRGEDFKVKVVTSSPDLKVKVVRSFADDVGEWRFVERGEDFKVRMVSVGGDFSIKFVDSFPGVNHPCH